MRSLTAPPPSKSQRLRALLFRVWECSAERRAGMDQETFYQTEMDKILEEVRRRLDPPLPDDPMYL